MKGSLDLKEIMGHLFCIMGKSSTGKDTIYKLLLERKDLNLNKIVSYTTRPIRSKEKPGEEYHFVTESEKDDFLAAGKVIEIRKYDTVFGPWYYFTADDGQMDLSQGDYIIIGTVESFLKLKEYYGQQLVIPIYIEVDDGERLERALKRERKQENPKYEEMCRRFLADAKDFSSEKIQAAGISNIFNNDDSIEDTCDAIADFINSR